MIIASWIMADVCRGNMALRLYRGLYIYGIQLGLYIWNPALYWFSRIHQVRACRQMLIHVWLPKGRRSSTGSTVRTLWSGAVFCKLTRNRSLSVLLPIWGENTEGNWFHTKAIESSERVRGRPARSSTNICQQGAVSQRPGWGNTSSYGIRTGHILQLISQGDGVHYPVGHPLFREAKETNWEALTRLPETAPVATMVVKGNAGTRLMHLIAGPKRGQYVCNTYLRSDRGCVSSTIDRTFELPTAAHWRERRVSVNQDWLVDNSLSPLGTQR